MLEALSLLFVVIDFLLQHFDVKLKLLLNFDVVAHFCLVCLQLRFVLFGREVDRLEGRREVTGCGIIQIFELVPVSFL